MARIQTFIFTLMLLGSSLAGCLDNSKSSEVIVNDSNTGFWTPSLNTTWQWQLTGEIDHSFDVVMYDIDLFTTNIEEIATLKSEGRVVICYFSAGSYEDFRSDSGQFPNETIGSTLDEWEGEWWLDYRDSTVREIMKSRLDLAVEKGCDGVEPDNMDGFQNDNGLNLTATDQLNYNLFIAAESHSRNLSVGLKNDLSQIPDLVDYYDWALNEECADYNECEEYKPFIDAGKAIFHVEYVNEESEGQALAESLCLREDIVGLSTLIKTWDLNPWVLVC